MRILDFGLFTVWLSYAASAQIPKPNDAPQPLTPKESAARFQVPPGFRVELVASEPLIRQPSGVCWDERGRLFVSELHGYNLEGQFDIDELNKTGKLDREVRRIQADEKHKQAALRETYGTVKLLDDMDGDGVMDVMKIFADRIPPAYGIVPARGGIIVACAPHILYLADKDDDGEAETQEILFTGFRTGALERGINAPQWGLDGWIYFGRGHAGGTITGPKLPSPVELGRSNFRIKADGSAIEPMTGATGTFGHATTEEGDRFVISTSRPGYFVTPLDWRHLARNPNAVTPAMEGDAGGYTRVFPLAPPHPWRSKRADDPGFFTYYRDRYGPGDSDAGGFFTSACSPLVYQDPSFPDEYQGNYFVCEPSQNLIHRALIQRQGRELRLHRAPGEEQSEFLASSDSWFHPMNLHHGPDGAIYIVDMYREIIEDYSAIPRYLQQQYGLTNGMDHGRVWRLRHVDASRAPAANMSQLTPQSLAMDVISPYYWRRETARRLLTEQGEATVAPFLSHMARGAGELSAVLNALYTLDSLGKLSDRDVERALDHAHLAVQRHALRLAEPRLRNRPALSDMILNRAQRLLEQPNAEFTDQAMAPLLLQIAVTLGATDDPRAVSTLAMLARRYGEMRWMPAAILSSVRDRADELFETLIDPDQELNQASHVLESLCRSLAAARSGPTLTRALQRLAAMDNPKIQSIGLRGIQSGLTDGADVSLPTEGYVALHQLSVSSSPDIRADVLSLFERFTPDDPAQQRMLLEQAARDAVDLKLPLENRLAAVARLGVSSDAAATKHLIAAWAVNTPKVRASILDALFSRRERLEDIMNALVANRIAASSLSAYQRISMLEHEDSHLREQAKAFWLQATDPLSGKRTDMFSAALGTPRDLSHGERVFREHCATCHQMGDIGFAVGPDLGAEFQRAEEAILRDMLFPNDAISAGYATYAIETVDGRSLNGVLADESATSLTLKQAAGLTLTVLRKDVSEIKPLMVSLMPEALAQTLTPQDVADVIAWLRHGAHIEADQTSPSEILFDDEASFLGKLNEGGGKARLATEGAFTGQACLEITPPQRYSVRIPGWNYRITENPGPGEYRYLRLAWRSASEGGAMIELAADGRWPDAQSPQRRYYAGRNTTPWRAIQISPDPPQKWQVRTLDLWKDNGAFTLTGIAPTAMEGLAYFDRIELLRDVRAVAAGVTSVRSGPSHSTGAER